jgi:hypothetical protein
LSVRSVRTSLTSQSAVSSGKDAVATASVIWRVSLSSRMDTCEQGPFRLVQRQYV